MPGGRPKGVREALPRGMGKALKALRHRVPEDASPEAKAIADEAMATVVNVMRGKGGARFVRERLTAAAMVREEVCGPVPKKLEHTGPEGKPISVSINGIAK